MSLQYLRSSALLAVALVSLSAHLAIADNLSWARLCILITTET